MVSTAPWRAALSIFVACLFLLGFGLCSGSSLSLGTGTATATATSATAPNKSKKKDLFYVYEWPDITNKYANMSDRDTNAHGMEFPYWLDYYGAGRLLNPNTMEHKTSQFSLFKTMYERALRDPRRTMDPDLASSFFIPYDFGLDATFRVDNGRYVFCAQFVLVYDACILYMYRYRYTCGLYEPI